MKENAQTAPLASLTFEAAMAELASTVQVLESGKLELEASIAAYQRGTLLLRHCQEQLREAEQKIQILDNGEFKTLDLETLRLGKDSR